MQRNERVQQLVSMTLATSAGMGSKEASKQIQEIVREHQVEMQQANPAPGAAIPLLEVQDFVNRQSN